ncbi:MAG TPA: HdeD family acid-resistance protein [Croceibacterium sp.]|nr:HdeD family acid-resistance protein [Croceibacterium sp.]
MATEAGLAEPSPLAGRLAHALAETWWLLLLRGLAAVLLGVLALVSPVQTIVALVWVWGFYAIADGILSLAAAVTGRGAAGPRWWLALVGLLGIAAGVVAFAEPALVAKFFALIIGFWAIMTGVLEIWGAIALRKEIDNEWMLVLSGVIAVLFGLILLFSPTALITLIWLVGFYALFFGLLFIVLAFRVRRHKLAP